MLGTSKTLAYNLKVILREMGIKADTLRAWERRYGLLDHHDIPLDVIPKYLILYKEAIDVNLGSQGKPILEWLERILNKNDISN